MNVATEFCRVGFDTEDIISNWVCQNLNFSLEEIGDHFTLGFFVGDKLVGGLIYHNIRPNRDVWWTIYTTDKRWCNRRVLNLIFKLAFNYLNVERISLLVNIDNHECIRLVKRLGFRREGLIRHFRDDGADCYFYGLLKSENKWKEKQMSKAIGKVLGAGGASTSMYGSEADILNYLNNYNTTNYDTTLNNLTNYASNASNMLNNMGGYNFSVNASDAARQRAEQAAYQSYVDRMTPLFSNQMSDLQASLANKGLSVGSEAYSRAMNDLMTTQNNALNQAAYQSVLAGQNAYSNSLNDSINAANFGNQAQRNYIEQLIAALQNSYSGYDVAMNKFNIQNATDQRIAKNKFYNRQAQQGAGDQFLNSAATVAMQSFMSDKRLKENIKAVGKLNNGLTVYCFNFKGSKVPQIGLLAQEVKEVNPKAVIEGDDGFLRVRYDIACEED